MENINRIDNQLSLKDILNTLKYPAVLAAFIVTLAGCDVIGRDSIVGQTVNFEPHQSTLVESPDCVSEGEVQINPVDSARNVVTFFLDESGTLIPDKELCDGILDVQTQADGSLHFSVRRIN